MLKPPTIPTLQFLKEVYQRRQPLAYYFEKWLPRLAKYRKDVDTRTSNTELLVKTIAIATRLYNERAKEHKYKVRDKEGEKEYEYQLTRELDEKDEFLLTFIDSWCYHWALREGFYRQQAEKKGKPLNSEVVERLDEETLKELGEGRTFNAKKIDGSNERDFAEIFRSKLQRRDDSKDWKCDLWADLVFVDLCRVDQNAFYQRFIDKYGGYFRTCFVNECKKRDILKRLRDDDYQAAIDYAFMVTIGKPPSVKAEVQSESDENGSNVGNRGTVGKGGKNKSGKYRGLCGLKNWVGRVFVNECYNVSPHPDPIICSLSDNDNGNKIADVGLEQRSRDISGLPPDDCELVEKYLKIFSTRFSELPREIQLALRFRFDHVVSQEKGRPISNVMDFTDSDLSAAATASGVSIGEIKKKIREKRNAINKLLGCFEEALREDLGSAGLSVLTSWALKTAGSKLDKDEGDESGLAN